MHPAIRRALVVASTSALAATQLACPPGVIDLIANTSADPIRVRVHWGSAVTRSNPMAEPTCPRPFFWLVSVSDIESGSGSVPRSLSDLEPASATYDESACSAIVTIPPGMAVSAGDPTGATNPRISFADRITIEQGNLTHDFPLGSYSFKREFDYGAPRFNVWRINLELGRVNGRADP